MRKKVERPIKIRQTWTRSPVQKVKESDKVYSRKKKKKQTDEEDKEE